MFDTICTLPLKGDLFTQAIHPTRPLLAVGLYDGTVETLHLPPVPEDDATIASVASTNGTGHIDSVWRTRRHKGSCRTLTYSLDGDILFSSGTDGLVKVASTDTGRVIDKIAIPPIASNGQPDTPSLLHILTPQTCLLATDSSALHIYDLRVSDTKNEGGGFKSRKAQQTHHPHTDYISSLTPLPPTEASTSGFSKQWVSTGGTTLAVTDVRRGVLVKSEDQEEELLSSVFVSGLSKRGNGTSVGEKIVVGGAGGVLTLWEKGQWDDQDERIVVDRGEAGGESLDVLSLLPDGVGPRGKTIAVGMGDGMIRFVNIGMNKVVGQARHDEVEGVIELGFDVGGRMISGGGNVVKVWHEKVDEDNGGYVDGVTSKRGASDDSDENDDDNIGDQDSDDSDDEDSARKRNKKRKRTKGKHLTGKDSFDSDGVEIFPAGLYATSIGRGDNLPFEDGVRLILPFGISAHGFARISNEARFSEDTTKPPDETTPEDSFHSLYQPDYNPFLGQQSEVRLVKVLDSWLGMVERGDWTVGPEGIGNDIEAFREADTERGWQKFQVPFEW